MADAGDRDQFAQQLQLGRLLSIQSLSGIFSVACPFDAPPIMDYINESVLLKRYIKDLESRRNIYRAVLGIARGELAD